MYSTSEVLGVTPSKRVNISGDIPVALSDYNFLLSAPGRLVGGTSSIAQGRVIGVTLGITPGEYALIYFRPEHLKGSGKPHADMGMMTTMTVQ